MAMPAQQFLEATAQQRPDSVALVRGERRLTYGAWDAAANRLARALIDTGVRRGDRVLILLDNSIETAISVFGVLKAGAAFVVLHYSTKRDRLAHILADAAPVALITDSAHVRDAGDLLIAATGLRCVLWVGAGQGPVSPETAALAWDALAAYPAAAPPCAAGDLDLGMLIYTSGSTGRPKGVMASHGNIVAATESVNGYLHNTADDVILDVLPLAFGYGLYQLFLAAQVGARVVLDQGFAFPARTVALLEQEQVTALPAVPTFYALLLRYPDLLRRPLPALRYLTNAGAAIPPSHLQQIRAAYPHVRFYSMYGQTECKRVCYLPPEEADRRPASVGIAIPNTEAYIVGTDGARVAPGAVGELVVRGPHVAQGYWRAPDLTAQRFRPGPRPGERVLYTGDLFRQDADGYLYFVARKDDIIKTRGEKVSPREVENAVAGLDAVAEAAVVGVPDPLLGQAILLAVVLREGAGLTAREIRAYCARRLDDFMVPQHVQIRAALPRTDNGKVDRRRIQAEFDPCTTTS
jgi:amino acid adenylation domain-containing protein